MKNAFLTAFLAVFLFGGCEKEVAISVSDGLEFCPVHFRMFDISFIDFDCPLTSAEQEAQLFTDDKGLVVSKIIAENVETFFYWNESLDELDDYQIGHWVSKDMDAGGLLKFDKITIDTGARFGLFLGPIHESADGTKTIAAGFGQANESSHQVWVARENDGTYSISARGGGKDTTVAKIPDFSSGYFRIQNDATNGRLLMWVFLSDASGKDVATIQINDATFNSSSIFANEKLGFGFGMELLPQFLSTKCIKRLCHIRLTDYMFGAPYANVSDNFECNSVIKN